VEVSTLTVKELIELLKLEPENAQVHVEMKQTTEFPRGSRVTGVDTEFDGRRTFVIITDFSE
jgi:hypothetical protein